MPITVNSPFSGRPVKIRGNDIGRAVKDEEGRVFYVVGRSDGNGYYSSAIRQGSAKDEQRYLDMEKKMASGRAASAQGSTAQIHDATGPGRPGTKKRALVLLVIVVILAAAAWYVLNNTDLLGGGSATPEPEAPADISFNETSPAEFAFAHDVDGFSVLHVRMTVTLEPCFDPIC